MIRFACLLVMLELPFFGCLWSQESTEKQSLAIGGDQFSHSNLDPRVAKLVMRIKAAQEAEENGIKGRTNQYINDLKALEQKIQATGNLDKVLEVSQEREAWVSGQKTPAFNPRDASIDLNLRKLRYYFDRDVQSIRSNSKEFSQKANSAFVVEIDSLITTCTKEGKIEEAVYLRRVKKHLTPAAEDITKSVSKPSLSAPISQKKKLSGNFWVNERSDYRPDNPLNPPEGSISFDRKSSASKEIIPVKIYVNNLPRKHDWALVAVSQRNGEFREFASGFRDRKIPEEITVSLYPFPEPWDFYLLAMTEKNWEAIVETSKRFDQERADRNISSEIKELRKVKRLKQDGNLMLDKATLWVKK